MKKIAMSAGAMTVLALMVGAQSQTNDYGDFRSNRGQSKQSYSKAIESCVNMVHDQAARDLANRHGLDLLSLTWEDTGRFKESSVGPNISDMTIQVDEPTSIYRGRGRKLFEGQQGRLMPVFRFPNFSDVTGEIDPDSITLMTGNEHGHGLTRTSLSDYLEDINSYLNPGRGNIGNLLADRDSKVLVSAQACFLPVPNSGLATFNPVIFNYQSNPGNPADLAILSTPQGTSAQIVQNNQSGSESWGQKLYFNNRGQKAPLTGERMNDFKLHERRDENRTQDVADSALNMVMLIQVPLVYRHREYRTLGGGGGGFAGAAPMAEKSASGRRGGSDVENAVIGHGSDQGPFVDLDGLTIERDPNFPIRMTVQFYKATSNGVVNQQDVEQIKRDIDRVYNSSDVVSSLVTGGETGRITEYTGNKVQPDRWWQRFWRHYELSSGETREAAIEKLRRLLGDDYMSRPVTTLYLRDLLHRR